MFSCHVCSQGAHETKMTHCVVQMLEQKAETKTKFTCDECLRSRSSMAEQGIVDPQAVGSVPTVTAKER